MTKSFYDGAEGDEFARQTTDLDMGVFYEPFLRLIPAGGKILDAGCGSGRDSKKFIDLGYLVSSIDSSQNMVSHTTKLCGQAAELLSFDQVEFVNAFDGIWACASLLHVPKSKMSGVLMRLCRSLKHFGVMYMSFKEGSDEVVRKGRLFSNYNEFELRDVIAKERGFEIVEFWATSDVRPGRKDERWLNVLVCRSSPLG